jgi:sterol desaturase/sphingolipid hydroxylase (fatty acid hydroxylase superfamily)
MTVLAIVLTIVLTYELCCLVQALLHRFVGHRPTVRTIFLRHTRSHHALYRPRTFERDRYADEELGVSHAFTPFALLLAAVAYWSLPIDLFLVSCATVAFTCFAHGYVHTHYHLRRSWLQRFDWFRRLRELHRVHHVDQRSNFGVLTLVWDRAMGTFVPARPSMRDKA